MKKIIILLLTLTMLFSFTACGNNNILQPSEADSVRYKVQNALNETTLGFGAQIDTDVFMLNDFSAEEKQMWLDRISDMNLQYTRIKFFPEYFERENDNSDYNSFDINASGVDFNSIEMQALYDILDICQTQGINVDLSWYGAYNWFRSADGLYTSSWLSADLDMEAGWVAAPKMIKDPNNPNEYIFNGYKEYAENISACLNYLLNTKGYTCIYGFSVIQEAFFDETGARSWEEYVKCCAIIDARLREDGLRNSVKFIGTSAMGHNLSPRNFKEEQLDVVDYFDVCGMGNYHWDYTADMETASNYFKDYVEVIESDLGKKGLIISEFCQGKHFATGAFNESVNKLDIDDYDAAIYHARVMISAMSNGVTAMDHYILGNTKFENPYFKHEDPTIHSMGLWKWRDNGEFDAEGNYYIPEGSQAYVPWAAHPEYYVWALICRYTEIGSTVYPIVAENKSDRTSDVMTIAFKMPDNTWSYMLVNTSTEDKNLAIVNEHYSVPASMNAYKVTQANIPANREVKVPASFGTVASGRVTTVTVPSNSFVVLSNMA